MKSGYLLSAALCAIASPALSAEARYAIDLPAQTLDASLYQVARATGVQLIFTDEQITHLHAPRVAGRYTLAQALSAVLARSGYTYRVTGENSVRIIRADTPRVTPIAYRQDGEPAPTGAVPAAADAPARNSTQEAIAATTGDADAAADIVVVGSRIAGSKVTAALPVTIVDAQSISATGSLSGDELFRSIPQMGDVSFNSAYLPNSSNSARGDVGSVNLRNLGVGNTLVLLNGRRVVNHPTSRADDNLVPTLTYNTNAIPVFGLERLEVLRDGAAAIYGSDAVAGVVNTVLRTNYNGVMAETQVGYAEDTSMVELNANLLAGTDLGGRGNVTLFASYDHRTSLDARDQDYTASADKRPLFDGTPFEGLNGLDGRSTITPWGSFQTYGNVRVRQGATNLTNASGQFHIQPDSNSGCQTALAGGLCIDDGTISGAADRNLRFDAAHAFNTSVIPAVKRLNLFLNGHYDLTDNLEFFGEAGYYRATTRSIQASTGTLSSGPLVIPASNYYNPFGPTTLPDGSPNPNRLPGIDAPADGQAITLSSYNFADVGPNVVNVKNEQFRLLGGLRFEALGFKWESALVYSEATVRDRSDGLSQTLLQKQLALATPDAYNPFSGGTIADPAGADATPSRQAAIDAIKITTTRFNKATLAMADLRGSRADLLTLPGGDVGFAFGGEIRRETQIDNRDPHVDGTIQFVDAVSGFVNASDLIGSSPSPDTRGRRTVAAAYAELAIPLVSPDMGVPLVYRAELQVAGRYEHYSDVGSVAKPKVAGAWDIVPGLRLRGSYAQGFKAPNLEQINATVVTRSNTRTDYVRCEADLRAGRITSFADCSQGFATSAQRSGNPDLKPETSTTWGAGVVLEPRFLEDRLGRMTFTVDYWNIRQKGIVGLFGEGNALINDYLERVGGGEDANVIRAAPTADDIALFAGTGLTPAGRVLFVRDKYVNLLPQTVSGVDFGFFWKLPDFGIGTFQLSANAAYLRKFFLQPSPPIQTLIDARAAGTINPGTIIAEAGDRIRQSGKPRWKGSGSLTWTYDRFQIGAYTQYTGSVEDTGLLDPAGVPWVIDDQMTFNLYAQVEVGGDSTGRYRLRIGVRNLTDAKPPLSSDGYLASLYNPYARYWYANFRASF